MKSAYFYIRSAFRKIDAASIKKKGCKLTKEEVFAISIHHAIPDAVGDYEEWIFDEDGQLLEGEN